jgi:NAD(P)-dependent dehydrogenase (short-subunit alcohol dehydrogenase family)
VAVRADLGDLATVRRLLEEAGRRLGALDLLADKAWSRR